MTCQVKYSHEARCLCEGETETLCLVRGLIMSSHSSSSPPDTFGIHLVPFFNYSEAEQLWAGSRAIDSWANARQLGLRWRSRAVTLLIIAPLRYKQMLDEDVKSDGTKRGWTFIEIPKVCQQRDTCCSIRRIFKEKVNLFLNEKTSYFSSKHMLSLAFYAKIRLKPFVGKHHLPKAAQCWQQHNLLHMHTVQSQKLCCHASLDLKGVLQID